MNISRQSRIVSSPIVEHHADGIHIFIPTRTPAALHEVLMRGISAGVRAHLEDQHEEDTDPAYIRNLMKLLEALLPNESQLQHAYGPKSGA